jgi:hypothetical protein
MNESRPFVGRKAGWVLGGFLSLSTVLVFPAVGVGSTGEMSLIRLDCRALDRLASHSGANVLFLGKTEDEKGGDWKPFKLPGDVPEACLRRAKVFFRGSGAGLVDLEIKSWNKEWVQHLRYYFRKDGSLEKIRSDFRRFGAYEKSKGIDQEFLVRVLRERYYGLGGKLLEKTKPEYFNVSKGRRVHDVVFKDDAPWPVYEKSDRLPFFDLLNPPVPPAGSPKK